jgi:hypothetical protein
LISKAKETGVGIVMGSRFIPARRALEGNMPMWKFLGNRCLTFLNSVLLGAWLSEFHTGYRVYSAEMVRHIPYRNDSDDYLFSFEIIAQSVYFGYGVAEIPAFSRYYKEASSCPPWGTIKYSVGALIASAKFRLQKMKLLKFDIFAEPSNADPSFSRS